MSHHHCNIHMNFMHLQNMNIWPNKPNKSNPKKHKKWSKLKSSSGKTHFDIDILLRFICSEKYFQHSDDDDDDDDNVDNVLKSKQWTVSLDVVHSSYIYTEPSFILHIGEYWKWSLETHCKIYEDRLEHLWFYGLLNTVPCPIICHQQFHFPAWTNKTKGKLK